VLGCDDTQEILAELQQRRTAIVETPEAVPRFTQAPGGTSSIEFGSIPEETIIDSARIPVGGQAHVILGTDASSAAFAEHTERRHAAAQLQTPDALARFPQAPGGDSSISMRGDAAAVTIPTRGPVGGEASLTLGDEDSKKIFEQHQKQRSAVVETPEAAPRFSQAPGGDSSVTSVATVAVRGPVGGETSITLGSDDVKAEFAQREQERTASTETPDAVARFPQAPGGDASICMRDDAVVETAAARGAVGGACTVVLGSDDSSEILLQHQQRRSAVVETPDAAPRFSQAPGGTSSIAAGSQGLLDTKQTAVSAEPARGPVGGQTTITLGCDDSAAIFAEHHSSHRDAAPAEAPVAAPRFPQAPGGCTSISIGGAESEDISVDTLLARKPVGGLCSVSFASAELPPREELADSLLRTPVGGATTIMLGGDGEIPVVAARGPVGGTATVVLGADASEAMFQQYKEHRHADIETPDAAPRFPQAPGGNASISMRGDCCADPVETRGPVGGRASVVLGTDSSKQAFAHREEEREVELDTPAAARRFQQTPGGTATIVLGGGVEEELLPTAERGPRQSPGGDSSLTLGGDYPDDIVRTMSVSANRFANGANQNEGNVLTDRPSTRLHHAPGGATSICLGDAKASEMFEGRPQSVRLADRFEQYDCSAGTGGAAALLLGAGYPKEVAKQPAASPSNQGASKRQAPGGDSSLCLGNERSHHVSGNTSSNKFANGSNQNAGNSITDRPTTKLHFAPGGKTSICLGNENVDTANIIKGTGDKTPLKSHSNVAVLGTPNAAVLG